MLRQRSVLRLLRTVVVLSIELLWPRPAFCRSLCLITGRAIHNFFALPSLQAHRRAAPNGELRGEAPFRRARTE